MATDLRWADIERGHVCLIFDTTADDWAMFMRIGGGMANPNYRLLVSWVGTVPDGRPTAFWVEDSFYDYYRVAPENVQAFIMAARHMNKEQWFRFARRRSERQGS